MELFPPVLNGDIFITKEYNMKKIVKITESDLTMIVKQVINESIMDKNYFTRRGIDYKSMFKECMERHNPCKYAKLSTYFNKVYENFIVRLLSSNEIIRDEMDDSYEDELTTKDSKLRYFIVDEFVDFVLLYYKIKCKREPK